MTVDHLPYPVNLKLDLMSRGIRYSEALGAANAHSFPNYYPYRFSPREDNPTGKPAVSVPYLMTLADGTLIRIKGNGESPWSVSGSLEAGYRLRCDEYGSEPVEFVSLPRWMTSRTTDGFDMAQTGLGQHADMLVVNVAPGCQYFQEKDDKGESLRCSFCTYGAPNDRLQPLGQVLDQTSFPPLTLQRLKEALTMALEDEKIHHIYLVGGSMMDWREEGLRFLDLARSVQEVVQGRVPVALGSGAIPGDILEIMHSEKLVQNVCFNLEVWSKPLFERICPGKNKAVGYENWIAALERAVAIWGRGHVYSAMVAGIELEPEHGSDWQAAADLALQGAEDLCTRGILPIYSLYWPLGGRDKAGYGDNVENFFKHLNLGYQEIRRRLDLHISDSFMCHSCAYMQIECDLDRHEPAPAQVIMQ
jgi:hypothetical protein